MDLIALYKRMKKEEVPMRCAAVILAAGNSQRMGFDKMTLMLEGQPVLIRAANSFEQSPLVDEIVVVTREDRLEETADLCRQYNLGKVTSVVSGGKTRTESALAGVLALKKDCPLVAVHDGARPFVTQELIERCIRKASIQYAAIPVVKSTDSLRTVDESGTLGDSLNRDLVVRVQTPQIFLSDLLKGALTDAVQRGMSFTDDATAVERMGVAVQTVDGDEENLKLTTPQDQILAEGMLMKRKAAHG